MGKRNNNSKESEYSSELEKYMEANEEYSSDDNNETDSFQTNIKGSSKLDEYLGVDDDEEEDEEIKYCSVCGKELKKFNYGDKCDECIKKIEVVNDLNVLLDYISPSEELKRGTLKFAGFDELKINIMISHLLDENLIVLSSKGIYLADVKTINRFFKRYGSANDLLDESHYKNVRFSESVDISKYSDLVQIIFNSKLNKWEVNLYRNRRSVLTKFFVNIIDANDFARRYLKEMGELDNLPDNPVGHQEVKARRSKHEFIFFSTKRNQWFVKVKGVARSKIVGFYDTEEEAVNARDYYIKTRDENRKKLRPRFRKDESDAVIKFHERSNQWIVIVKTKKGRPKKLGFYDTEEEAIAAKNEYYGIDDSKLGPDYAFGEGDRVQIISGPFELEYAIIKGYDEERDAFIVELEEAAVPIPVLMKSDFLKLI